MAAPVSLYYTCIMSFATQLVFYFAIACRDQENLILLLPFGIRMQVLIPFQIINVCILPCIQQDVVCRPSNQE